MVYIKNTLITFVYACANVTLRGFKVSSRDIIIEENRTRKEENLLIFFGFYYSFGIVSVPFV